jgi:two-component system, OmpR family, phosphate regulon sensor histidine kinase PhoR
MRVIGAGVLIASVPVAGLALVAAEGEASVGHVLLAIGGVLLAAMLLATLWSRDLDVLSDIVRQADGEDPAARPDRAPILPGMRRLGRELDRLTRRVAARAAQVEQFRRADGTVVERLPDPLIVLAVDRSVLRANAAARAAFGVDMPAVLRHPDLRAAIDRALVSGSPQTADVTLPVPVPREVQTAVVPMVPALPDGGLAVVVLSDRSRERAIERTRVDFVANANHELRTPLASLIGFIDTLRGPAADDHPAQQHFLGIMAEQAMRMNRLIDDMLSLSRVEQIEHQAPTETVSLHALVTRVAAGVEPQLRERSVSLDLRMADDVPGVVGDADQLTQVVQNLLDNAVKYGRDGGTVRIEVGVAAGAQWPARPGVVVSVADQGAGIPRAHLPRLTERFYRVDTGRSRAAGGTGLGLAIVKHIVNRHRGQLLIESEEGVGTTVSIWLPQAVN